MSDNSSPPRKYEYAESNWSDDSVPVSPPRPLQLPPQQPPQQPSPLSPRSPRAPTSVFTAPPWPPMRANPRPVSSVYSEYNPNPQPAPVPSFGNRYAARISGYPGDSPTPQSRSRGGSRRTNPQYADPTPPSEHSAYNPDAAASYIPPHLDPQRTQPRPPPLARAATISGPSTSNWKPPVVRGKDPPFPPPIGRQHPVAPPPVRRRERPPLPDPLPSNVLPPLPDFRPPHVQGQRGRGLVRSATSATDYRRKENMYFSTDANEWRPIPPHGELEPPDERGKEDDSNRGKLKKMGKDFVRAVMYLGNMKDERIRDDDDDDRRGRVSISAPLGSERHRKR